MLFIEAIYKVHETQNPKSKPKQNPQEHRGGSQMLRQRMKTRAGLYVHKHAEG